MNNVFVIVVVASFCTCSMRHKCAHASLLFVRLYRWDARCFARSRLNDRFNLFTLHQSNLNVKSRKKPEQDERTPKSKYEFQQGMNKCVPITIRDQKRVKRKSIREFFHLDRDF